jgi:RNA polymerase sigma factor for flagellar operon FliA
MIERLWKNYSENKTPEAREELIVACLRYVKSCAHQLAIYVAPSQDVDDLIGAGIIGLMDAVDRYDPRKGASFKTYASCRIRGSIIDEVRSMDWVPYSTREKARRLEKAMQTFQQNSDLEPDDEDIAEAMGMSLEKYHETLLELNRMTLLMLDEIFYDEDFPEDELGGDPEEQLITDEIEAMLADAIEHLPEKERLVVTLYYYEEMTMKEIGGSLNISESRVCQIHSSAILRLHSRLKYADASVNRR